MVAKATKGEEVAILVPVGVRDREGEVDGDREGYYALGECGGPGEGGFRGGTSIRRSYMVSGGHDTQGERVLLRYKPHGGGVEGSGGDYKLQAYSLHRLPLLLPWVPGSSQHRHCHPLGQTASSVSGHE